MYIGTHHSNFNHQNLAAKGLTTGWKVGIPLETTYWPLVLEAVASTAGTSPLFAMEIVFMVFYLLG